MKFLLEIQSVKCGNDFIIVRYPLVSYLFKYSITGAYHVEKMKLISLQSYERLHDYLSEWKDKIEYRVSYF